MSEHMGITGDIEFYHLAYEKKGSFSYCHHCKRPKTKLTIELHEGIVSDWILVRCPDCKKAIWGADLTSGDESHKKSSGRRYIIDEKKRCIICGKVTNRWDCYSYSFTKSGRVRCYCSKRCDRQNMKRLIRKYDTKSKKS